MAIGTKSRTCFCVQMGFTFGVCRWFGLFPISWSHQSTGRCVYTVSTFWCSYSLVVSIIPIRSLYMLVQLDFSKMLLPYILSYVNEGLSSISTTVIILTTVIRAPKMVDALNGIPKLRIIGLFCQQSLNSARRFQYGVNVMLVLMYLTQTAFLIVFDEDGIVRLEEIFLRMIGSIPICFYILFMQVCLTCSIMFSCFNQIAMKTVCYQRVHPCSKVEEIPSKYMFFAYINRKPCKNRQHTAFEESLNWNNMEKLDLLRDVHNLLCETFNQFSISLNPNLLIFMSTELAATVLNGYALIILARYASHMKSLMSFILVNWSFILWRICGMLMLINSGSTFHTEYKIVTNILYEYASRLDTIDEYRQARMFIQRIRYLPLKFNPSGVVGISMELIGSISSNLLTYLLVALQFRPPPPPPETT